LNLIWFDRRYFVVGAGGGVGGVLLPLAGGKVLSRNWSRMPAFMRFVFTGFFELSLMFSLELQTWCFVIFNGLIGLM
jgi:hypothetical protein